MRSGPSMQGWLRIRKRLACKSRPGLQRVSAKSLQEITRHEFSQNLGSRDNAVWGMQELEQGDEELRVLLQKLALCREALLQRMAEGFSWTSLPVLPCWQAVVTAVKSNLGASSLMMLRPRHVALLGSKALTRCMKTCLMKKLKRTDFPL